MQIETPSAHITPSFTPLLSSGTLPLGESGCIPEHPPFIRATPVPFHTAPQSTNPDQSTSSPPSSSAPCPRVRFKPEKVPTAFTFPCPPSDLGSEGWSTEEGDKESGSSNEEFNPYLSDSDDYHPLWKGNIWFDDLAQELDSIVFGFNNSDDEYGPNIRLRETYINMMQDPRSTLSLNRLQYATAQLLSQLIENRLFVHTPASFNALWGLIASMLSYPRFHRGLSHIATGEDNCFPLPLSCTLTWPASPHQSGSDPSQPSPHVSGTAEETAPEGDKASLSHVTVSHDQQNKRSKCQ